MSEASAGVFFTPGASLALFHDGQVQASVLRRSPEIVVATPGRLIDHLRNTQSVGLEDLSVLVLDEADRCGCC